ncbi:blue copper protein-like [Phragmites australis]|uniref:blue copper protein-like n=1 Tax=Phragmites australis TaxID=29695 RepID=UPI002D777B22|nr:blue copper protein-like [Phragmites australis]
MANTLALVVLLVAGYAALASATTYTVGDSQGWTTGGDYNNWARGKTFAVGDKLVFSYVNKAHTVTEVNQSGYDSCSGTNALSDDDSGSTTVTLTTPGTHYFICNVPGHCASGMKLAVTVSATPSGSTPTGGAAGDALKAPAMGALVAAATGALIKLAMS